LLPVSLEFLYIHWMRQFETYMFPPVFQASPIRVIRFYGRLGHDVWTAALFGVLAGAVVTRWRDRPRWIYQFSLADAAIGLGMFAMPFMMVAALMRRHSAFHWRYAIVGSIVIWAVFSLAANYWFRNGKVAATAFVVGILAVPLWRGVLKTAANIPQPGIHSELTRFKPELPFVAGSGLTFLELDHYESPELTSRLYYLTDREYATRYAHATLWEGYRLLNQYFPIRGNIAYYREFIAQHPRFLVLGTSWYIEDWLLRRLQDEKGMTVKKIAILRLPYKDTEVYEVQRSPQAAKRE
jgi:hypothetical protein